MKLMRTMLKSKIHRANVTDANIDYEGSITLDKNLMEAADIIEYERVLILDVNNGARLETYAIEGKRGKGDVIMNGAAARLVHKGDKIIIMTFSPMEDAQAKAHHPKIVYVNEKNAIKVRAGKQI